MSDYKPSTKEVLSEIVNHYKLRKFERGAGEAVGSFFVGLAVGASFVHTIPLQKKLWNDVPTDYATDISVIPGRTLGRMGATGYIIGIISLFPQVLLYGQVVAVHHHPEALLIPVATNLISGGYEVVRNAKKRLQEKNSLENTLSGE